MPSARAAISYESYLIAPYAPGDGQLRLAAGSDGIWAGASVDTPGYLIAQSGAAQAVYSCTGSAGEVLTGVAVVEGRDLAFPAGAAVRLCTAPAGGGGGTGTIPETGATITQHIGGIVVPSGTSGTINLDLSLSDYFAPAALTGAATFTFSNPPSGKRQVFFLHVIPGGFAITWPGTVKWPGGTAPTPSSTAGKIDLFGFLWDGTSYLGTITGQNF